MSQLQNRPLRKSKSNRARDTQQLLLFRLHQNGFALPLSALKRVASLEARQERSVISYEDQEVQLINLAQYLAPYSLVDSYAQTQPDQTQSDQEFLIILQNHQQSQLLGLLISDQPNLRRVDNAAFQSLPSSVAIPFVKALITLEKEGELTYLLLDHQELQLHHEIKELKASNPTRSQ